MDHKKIIAILGILFLSGCSTLFYDPDRSLDSHFINYQILPPVSAARFTLCNHYGCTGLAEISLTQDQWQQVKNLFSPPAATAETERERLATAVGLMERLVGPQSNTAADQACNNFQQPLIGFQLDCVAEATNTSVFLQLFQRAGLLRWHQVRHPAQRGLLLIFSAHLAAVIQDLESEELFAVDSWFYANGEKAVIVPLTLWQENYYPAPCR